MNNRFSNLCQGILLAFLVAFAGASTLSAQTNTTALSGTITDPAGLKLTDTTISLQNTKTGEVSTAKSKAAGEYDFTQVIPSHYKVIAEHAGFVQQEVELDLEVATPQTLNFKMIVGSTDTVMVEAPIIAPSLNQVDATLGKTFNNTQIQQLPYLANNTLGLLALQPGVISIGTDATSDQDARNGTINGARQDQTNITLDGTDNNDSNLGYAFTGVLRSTRDSIEEFRVTTGGGNADSGRSSGAQVSLQTKSGTNSYHGSAYYYYRDPAMASNDWFNKQTQIGAAKSNIPAKILQDTYGTTLGIPLKKDKLFFFGAYEGFKQASDKVVSATVPLGDGTQYGTGRGLRNGTLTYLKTGTTGTYITLTPAQIATIDPNCSSTGACPAGPGVDQALQAFYKANYPVSNTTGGDTVNTGGFSFTSPAPISQITNVGRIDYIINPKQTMFVRGNLQGDNQLDTIPLPGGQPKTNTYTNNRGITGGHIWNISANTNNNFRYGWTREGSAVRGASSSYISFAAIGLPFGTTFSTILLQNTQNFVDDFTMVRGKHTITLGGNDRLTYNHRTLSKFLYQTAEVYANEVAAGGILNQNTSLDVNYFIKNGLLPGFDPTMEADKGFQSSYNNSITALTGVISQAQAYSNYSVSSSGLTSVPTPIPHEFRSFEQEYYIQDQYKVIPKLTLTAGLRFSHLGVPYELNGQQVRPTTSMTNYLAGRIAAMGAGANYNPAINTGPGGPRNNQPGFWNGDKVDVAPRLAFNYGPDSKTSIRGGFMLAYDHFGMAAINNYNDSYSFGLASVRTKGVQGTVDGDPRWASEFAVPQTLLNDPAPGGPFPITQNLGPGGITQTFDDSLKTPYAETFNLSVQREIHKGLTFTASYNGRLGRHLLVLRDVLAPLDVKDPASGEDYFQAMTKLDIAKDAGIATANVPNDPYWTNEFPNLVCKGAANQTQAIYGVIPVARGNETAALFSLDAPGNLPAACTDNGNVYDRFFASQYGSLYAQAAMAISNYNSGQFSLRHVVNRSIIYDFNYTLAHSMDMGSNPERSGSNAIINTFSPRQMYANSSFDTRHAITADWVASLPFGHGQRFGASSSKLMDELFGGWQLTGVLKYESAFPWTATVKTSGWGTNWENSSADVQIAPINSPGHHAYYPSVNTSTGAVTGIAGSAFGSGVGAISPQTNGTTIAGAAAAAAADFRVAYVGESGQHFTQRADGYFSLDPGLSKTFHTFERQSFKLVVEYFNATNAIRFGGPSNTLATFGQYTSTNGVLNSPRQAQIAGRYTF